MHSAPSWGAPDLENTDPLFLKRNDAFCLKEFPGTIGANHQSALKKGHGKETQHGHNHLAPP
jgi:hypothetical protein